MMILSVTGKILLTLLKIVLILLAVLLILLLIVLIAPIGYEAAGKGDGSAGLKGIDAKARIKILFGLIGAVMVFRNGTLAWQLKAAGKVLRKGGTVLLEPEEAGEEGADRREFAEEEAGQVESAEEEAGKPEFADEEAGREEPAGEKSAEEASGQDISPEEKTEENSGRTDSAEEGTEKESGVQPEPAGEEAASRSLEERLEDIAVLIADRFAAAQDAADAFSDRAYAAREKMDVLRDKAVRGWDMTQDPDNRRTFSLVIRQASKILRHVMPRVFRAKGTFGTDDPALTGQLLGAVYALVPFLPENSEVRVTGNFQEKQIKGKLFMKGRIHLIVIAGAVLRLLPDKNIRQLIFGLLKKRKQK